MDTPQFTYESEQARSAALAKGLRSLATIASELPELALRASDLQGEAKNVEEGRFSIVVLGAFNRGKSTLLNAMFGTDVLPMAAVPTTAIITLLKYSPTEQITVHLKDGVVDGPFSAQQFKEKYVLPVEEEINAKLPDDLDDIDDETELEERRLKAARDMFSHIDYAEVGFPCDLTRRGVEFIDTPGFEDDDARTERAKGFLEKSHAVLYLLDATQPATERDMESLRWVASRGERAVFFPINKWNLLEYMEKTPAGRASVEKRFRSKLAKHLTKNGRDLYERRVFKLDALGAYEARLARPMDQAKLENSNLPVMERALEQFLVEDRVEARDNALLSKAGNLCDEMDTLVKRMLGLRQRSLEDLIEMRKKVEDKLNQLRAIVRQIEEYLEGKKITVQKNLAESLASHMANLDAQKIIGKLNLTIIEDTWLSLQAPIDVAKKVLVWVKLYKKGALPVFKDRVRMELEPQLEKVIKKELETWGSQQAGNVMKAETEKMVKFLREEAAGFNRILHEIADILDQKSDDIGDVEELVRDWLAAKVAQGRLTIISPKNSDLAIDMGPLAAAIAVEVALHLKGALIPVLGTLAAIVVSVFRQEKTVEKIKAKLAEGLEESLVKIPDAEQRRRIDADVEKEFEALEKRVLTNIALKINSIQVELNTAIKDVQDGEVDIEGERKRLEDIQQRMRQELAGLRESCAAGN